MPFDADLVDVFQNPRIPSEFLSNYFMQNSHLSENDLIQDLDFRLDRILENEGFDQIVEIP